MITFVPCNILSESGIVNSFYELFHDLWMVSDKTDCILLSDTSKFLLCLLFSAHKMVDPPCAPGRNPAWGDLENISIYSFVALEF